MRFLAIIFLLAGTAAQASDDNPAMTKSPKGAFPFSGSVSWGHNLGQGSFVQNYYARDAAYSQSLGLSGSWALPWKGFRLSAKQGLSMELTTGGAMRNHELNYGDIGLGLSTPLGFKVAGFQFGTSFGAGIPVSKVSRFMGKITGLSGNLGGSRTFGKVSVSLGLGLASSLYTERLRTVSVAEGRSFVDSAGHEITPLNQICRSEELVVDGAGAVTGCKVPGVNGGLNLSSSLAVSYKLNDKISLSTSLALINSFKDYRMPDDEFTPDNANTGIGRSDMTSGSLSMGYAFSKALRFGLAMASTQPALFWSPNDVADENGNISEARAGTWLPNFPWWDFRTPGNNFSSFSGSVSYSF